MQWLSFQLQMSSYVQSSVYFVIVVIIAIIVLFMQVVLLLPSYNIEKTIKIKYSIHYNNTF